MRKKAATIGKMQNLQNEERNKENGVPQSNSKMNKRSIVPEASMSVVGLVSGGIVLASCIIPEGNGRADEKVKRMMPESTE